MRILPITVSTDLIQPILDDRKLRTRRIMNPQINCADWSYGMAKQGIPPSPWQKGDILYVREEHYAFGWWEDVEGEFTATGKQKTHFVHTDDETLRNIYYSNYPQLHHVRLAKYGSSFPGWHKRLARFMPKTYARIFLEVTDVRVERLQDITESEAVLEGIGGGPVTGWQNYQTGRLDFSQPISSFWSLWQKINGPGTWGANPWVWVISFKRVERPANF